MIKLYAKNGQFKLEIHEYTYNGAFMGESCLVTTIKSDAPIDFEIGDYVVYKGNPFTLNYIPAKQKLASAGSYREAFVYDSVKFNSLGDELTRCRFLDIVVNDNNTSYSQLPNFSFTANTPQDLANRIQANLDRDYSGDQKWTINVHPGVVLPQPVPISAQNVSCWDALTYANSQLKLNYVINGRTVTIGTSGVVIDKVFEYGKDKGLFQIKQSANADAQIITRLRAYGSTRNISSSYYKNKKRPDGTSYMPGNMYAPNLMLPGFPQEKLDPFLPSKNIDEYGLREGCVFFDGQNGTKEIYPSLEDVTAEQLIAAGYTVSLPPNDNGNIDEILACDNPKDDGTPPGDGQPKIDEYFNIYLKDLGFNLAEPDPKDKEKYKYAATDKMQIAVNTGMCGGRTFDLQEKGISVDNTKGYPVYKLVCKRVFDKPMNEYFPSSVHPINFYDTGNDPKADKFVLLGITLPDAYVDAASVRLQTAAENYLKENEKTKYSYEPVVDNLYLAKHPDVADQLTEGALLVFMDADLNIDTSSETIGGEIIQSITIDYGKSDVPEYKLSVSNEKNTGTLQKMQESINSIAANLSGVTVEQVLAMIRSVGATLFLSKRYQDTAQSVIKYLEGIDLSDYTEGFLGAGGTFRMVGGDSFLECDKLSVRKEAVFRELKIEEMKYVGGQLVLSPASMVCSRVEEVDGIYRCYFDMGDKGESVNEFVVGDQARCQVFNGTKAKYYWRLVVGVGQTISICPTRIKTDRVYQKKATTSYNWVTAPMPTAKMHKSFRRMVAMHRA